MKLSLLTIMILMSISLSQTPFEFGVVQNLIQGEPFISVISIKTVSGTPSRGCATLKMTVRAGLVFAGESSSFLPDSLIPGNVSFSGQVLYSGTLPVSIFERLLSVISTNMNRFPGTGITHLSFDLVSVDDMSWVSIRCPVSRADSLLDGSIDHLEFWRRTEVLELEVGTYNMPVTADAPRLIQQTIPISGTIEPEMDRYPSASSQAWKSLVLPGWGQLSSGRGFGWLNLAVEAAGIALIVSENEEAGAAVLGVNHVISFIDLF